MAEEESKKALIQVNLDGKPLEKLIEVVSNGIGILYKPRAMRKEADAEAYRMEVLIKAEAKKNLIIDDNNFELAERTKRRLATQEINRQGNMEDVVEKTFKYMPDEVSQEPVEKDWQSRFFNKAQDISDEEMQEIWAKMLAKEVADPKSFSVRTLEVLSNLSQDEVELFQRLTAFVTDNTHILKLSGDALDEFGIDFNAIIKLVDAGLVMESSTLVITSKNVGNAILNLPNYQDLKNFIEENSLNFFIVALGGKTYNFKPIDGTKREAIALPQIKLTTAGSQLCAIIKSPFNEEYRNRWIEIQGRIGFIVTEIPTVNEPNN